MRSLASVMEAGAASILGEARAILDWHARHKFCAVCGTATGVHSAGWCRRCPSCKAQHFPRTDPVVIMLPVRGERCLLGRNARAAGARFSCLPASSSPARPWRRRCAARCSRNRPAHRPGALCRIAALAVPRRR